jgi:NAD(P)-dependent dehydrogenase (short-subunit alcohol dehydrogenase family)
MNLNGKIALITGSTDGVGRYVAVALAADGAHVLVHGRDRERAQRLLDDIRRAGGSAAFYPADLSSLAAVREFAEAVLRDHDRLDLLINNAGIGTGGRAAQRAVSTDGHELRFAVNYLSGYLLTRLLLARLQASGAARIVNVSSLGQHPIDFDDVMITQNYSGMRAYAQSKLAQIMFTFDLAQELGNSQVSVNALHPATYMDTTMVREGGATPISTVQEGGAAILRLAGAAEMDGKTGGYFDGLRPARAHQSAYDLATRTRLRLLSNELISPYIFEK